MRNAIDIAIDATVALLVIGAVCAFYFAVNGG